MITVETIKDARSHVLVHKIVGRKVALVPTMGALHEGHLHLVDVAKQHADLVVMSIFVNPTQFNSSQDLTNYPRQLEADIEAASKAGVDILFAPNEEEIYSSRDLTYCSVKAGSRSLGLCGAKRPGHFDGVVTVVSILFNIINPDIAVFGEKDYQQLKVLEQLVMDLKFNIEIIPAKLIRDKNGLALSSRNALLSAKQITQALSISKSLKLAQDLVTKERVPLVNLKN